MTTSQISEAIQHLRRTVFLRDGGGLTDGQLLERYRSGHDETALTVLVRRHGPMVWGVCRRIVGNYHDAEDAFQTTFLVLVRKAASIASPELLANWLYGVAYQTALNARATAARRRARERQVTEMPEPAVAEQDLWSDLQPLLDEELSRLPDKYRAVIVLCDLEDKTRKEAARQLGVPEGTVAGQLARARVMLAKRLAQRGVALSGGALAAVLAQNLASASVPSSMVAFTIKAASFFAAGQAAAAGVVSVKAAALTEGVLKMMLLTKLKIATAVVLVLVAIGIGVGTVLPQVLAQDSADKKSEAPKDTWKPAGVLEHKHRVLCVAFGPDLILLASDEGPPAKGGELFRVWDAATKSEVDPQRGEVVDPVKEIPDDLRIVGITYAADNSLVSLRAKKAIHLHRGDSIQAGPLAGGGTGSPVTLATAADCKTHAIVGSEKNTVMMYKYEIDFDKNKASSEDGAVCKGHEDEPLCAAFSRDGSLLVTGSADKTARIWDPTSGNEKHVLRGHTDSILVVAFSPDGKSIATGGKDGLVKLWDANTGKEKASLKGHTVVRCLTFSPDGKTLVSGGEDQTVRIWDAKTGAEKAVLRNHKGTVLTVAFSRDGTLLASAGTDKTIRLWQKK